MNIGYNRVVIVGKNQWTFQVVIYL